MMSLRMFMGQTRFQSLVEGRTATFVKEQVPGVCMIVPNVVATDGYTKQKGEGE